MIASKNPKLFGVDGNPLFDPFAPLFRYSPIRNCWSEEGSRRKVRTNEVATAMGVDARELTYWEQCRDNEESCSGDYD